MLNHTDNPIYELNTIFMKQRSIETSIFFIYVLSSRTSFARLLPGLLVCLRKWEERRLMSCHTEEPSLMLQHLKELTFKQHSECWIKPFYGTQKAIHLISVESMVSVCKMITDSGEWTKALRLWWTYNLKAFSDKYFYLFTMWCVFIVRCFGKKAFAKKP